MGLDSVQSSGWKAACRNRFEEACLIYLATCRKQRAVIVSFIGACFLIYLATCCKPCAAILYWIGACCTIYLATCRKQHAAILYGIGACSPTSWAACRKQQAAIGYCVLKESIYVNCCWLDKKISVKLFCILSILNPSPHIRISLNADGKFVPGEIFLCITLTSDVLFLFCTQNSPGWLIFTSRCTICSPSCKLSSFLSHKSRSELPHQKHILINHPNNGHT